MIKKIYNIIAAFLLIVLGTFLVGVDMNSVAFCSYLFALSNLLEFIIDGWLDHSIYELEKENERYSKLTNPNNY